MLAMTNQAATAIRNLTTQPGLSEETGLRIESTTSEDQTPTFALSLTAEKQPEDHVIEAEGARVIVDAATAAELDDKALDAEISEEGQVQFLLAAQS
ncbi:Fe-S cluster assembly protein HesB [Phytoactinopolyspora endophytica]|uniref:Fe-S cluster assembly protein HesB n=1 Tax=Phytoactinopolyspora endophytica TaxID=1642495 RepID=UPI00101D84C9|nr:Fe-S cluster assembly protein HesB [Phytoactinopolyspora endophytica]